MSCRNRGWESKVHWTVSDFGLRNFFGHIRFLGGQTITPGILPLPELADGFCGLVQPVRVSQQRDESNGAEKLHRVWGAPVNEPHRPTMPTPAETVLSQILLAPGSPAGTDAGHASAPESCCAGVLCPEAFGTCLSFRLGNAPADHLNGPVH